MKKSLISLAIVTGMAASGAAFAEATLYGNVHLSFDDWDKTNDSKSPMSTTNTGYDINGKDVDSEPELNSNTSAIGVKGSEDLGDGLKALYKVEFQVDIDDRQKSSLVDRDQWVGIKGGMGTVKIGTMTSNYKQMGGKIDPMYRTALEGRGALGTQSPLHGGAGTNGGRMSNAIQYSSPKMGGMQMIVNTTVTKGGDAEAAGVGFRYSGKGFMGYFDYLDTNDEIGSYTGKDEKAMKIGGSFKAGPVKIGAQFEDTEDLAGTDYMFLSANYGIDKNNSVALTVGQQSAKDPMEDSKAFALMYNHKMSKMTNVYAGYGDYSHDESALDNSVATVGIRKKF